MNIENLRKRKNNVQHFKRSKSKKTKPTPGFIFLFPATTAPATQASSNEASLNKEVNEATVNKELILCGLSDRDEDDPKLLLELSVEQGLEIEQDESEKEQDDSENEPEKECGTIKTKTFDPLQYLRDSA